MVNKPKAKGTRGETKVVNFLKEHGINARRAALAGAKDEGDIHIIGGHGCVSAVLEVKAGKQTLNVSRYQRELWLEETESEAAATGSVRGFLVIARHGSSVIDYHVWSTDGHRFWYLDQFVDFVKGGY